MQSIQSRFVSQLDKLMGRARAIARRLGVRAQDVDDVVNDALVRALKRLPTLRSELALETWFVRIVENRCWTHLRIGGKRRHYSLRDLGDEANGYIIPEPSVEPDLESVFWSGDETYELGRLLDDASPTNRPRLLANVCSDGTREQRAKILHERAKQVGDGDKTLKRYVVKWLEEGNLYNEDEHPTGRLRRPMQAAIAELRTIGRTVMSDHPMIRRRARFKDDPDRLPIAYPEKKHRQRYQNAARPVVERFAESVGCSIASAELTLTVFQEISGQFGLLSRWHPISDSDDTRGDVAYRKLLERAMGNFREGTRRYRVAPDDPREMLMKDGDREYILMRNEAVEFYIPDTALYCSHAWKDARKLQPHDEVGAFAVKIFRVYLLQQVLIAEAKKEITTYIRPKDVTIREMLSDPPLDSNSTPGPS